MKHLIITLFLFSTLSFAQIKKGNTINNNQQLSTPILIELSYSKGEINLDQRITYLVYYLKDYSKLPSRYKSFVPEKCGTWIAQIIFNNFPKLKPETKKTLSNYRVK